MPVVMVIAALVVLVVVVYVATGRGGELSPETTDHAPLDLGPVSATDVALLRPPTALWGYSVQATDEALERIAESIRQRDVRIVALEQLVTDLSREPAPQPPGSQLYPAPRHRRTGEFTPPTLPAVLRPPPDTDITADTSAVPATVMIPVAQEGQVPPAASAASAAGGERGIARADEDRGAADERGVSGGEPGAGGGGAPQRERGVSGGGPPPEQSHG